MKIIIHNFYGKSSPSGEDNFVRRLKKDKALFAFSEVFYRSDASPFIIFVRFRRKMTIRLMLLLKNITNRDNIEVNNITPFIDTKILKKISLKANVTIYAHNFRLVAPCAVLMDNKGLPCDLCVRKKSTLLITPFWKCYRNSAIQTFIMMILILRHKLFGHFRNVYKVTTFSEFHKTALRPLVGENTRFEIITNTDRNAVEAYSPGSKHTSVVFIGRLSPEKGILRLMQAWREQDIEQELHIYGDGVLGDDVRSVAACSGNIYYHGFIEPHKIKAELSRHSSLIIPSLCAEGYPTVINDALHSDLRLISVNVEPQATHVLKLGGDVYDFKSQTSLGKVLAREI